MCFLKSEKYTASELFQKPSKKEGMSFSLTEKQRISWKLKVTKKIADKIWPWSKEK